jgi:class 3 adenylate cyclase
MLRTDIVDSTKTAADLGDAAWRQRLANHNRLVRRQLERFGGREVKTTGDGFLAASVSAEAGLRAALSAQEALVSAGIVIRSGVHTGEVDILAGGDLRGIAVHEAARIMAAAPVRRRLCLRRIARPGLIERPPLRVGAPAHPQGGS